MGAHNCGICSPGSELGSHFVRAKEEIVCRALLPPFFEAPDTLGSSRVRDALRYSLSYLTLLKHTEQNP